uniref:Uncharacterized protein MANES_S084800 n=1 Tax=Rhizophora mucronata TaxID=61149 RepID=A0A2P2LNF4_RHIMU
MKDPSSRCSPSLKKLMGFALSSCYGIGLTP